MAHVYVYTADSAMHPNIFATYLCINIYTYKYYVCMYVWYVIYTCANIMYVWYVYVHMAHVYVYTADSAMHP